LSAFVLDASTVLAWLLRESAQAQAEAAIARAAGGEAAAPRLLALEVPNGLRNRVRRSLLSAADRDEMLEDFWRLPIVWDDQADAHDLVAISDQQELTIYDATYLELARRLGIPLSTMDTRLAEAARRAGASLRLS
jgi:predicted nucleic acid-binding protein